MLSLEDWSHIATIAAGFSVPLALAAFVLDQKKQKAERELQAYLHSSREYRDYLRLCIENNDLHTYDYMADRSKEFTPDKRRRRMAVLDVLVSTMETAYFLYQDESTELKRKQWEGWEQYIADWCSRPDFRQAWKEYLGYQYDKNFLATVNAIMERVVKEEADV